MSRKILFLIMTAVISVSCASTSTLTTPEGFAHFDKEKNYRAVSADGISIVSYVVESKSVQEDNPLETWVKEADRVLASKGYTSLSASRITLRNGVSGTYLEYEVIFNAETWVYAALVAKDQSRLVIAEVSGEKNLYLKRKDRIVESLKTIEVK
jgi:hypothetical protein